MIDDLDKIRSLVGTTRGNRATLQTARLAAKPALFVMLGAVPDVPSEWAEGAAKLRAMAPPAAVPPAAWTALLRASDRFLSEGHAAKAAALGWTALDVWGCHAHQPAQRLAGAAWLIGDSEIAAIGPHTIGLRNSRSSSQLTIYRRDRPASEPVCLAWELKR